MPSSKSKTLGKRNFFIKIDELIKQFLWLQSLGPKRVKTKVPNNSAVYFFIYSPSFCALYKPRNIVTLIFYQFNRCLTENSKFMLAIFYNKSMKKIPDPNKIFPNEKIPSLCYIKNVVKNPRIIVGDYTYYDDVNGADQFEKHVTHFYDFIGDKLIIGKFCAIAKGVEFVMNGANHRMECASTYPFYIMGGDWGNAIAPVTKELPLKGDTVIGNDVWIGQNVTILPGVHIGDGAIIGANSVVAKDIPPYTVAVGNPCRVVKKRLDDELIDLLLKLKWWDKSIEEIDALIPLLSCSDLNKVKQEIKKLVK